MAAYRTSAAGGSTSGTGNRTVAITPAVGDLLVVYCFVSTNTNDSPTCSDNNGGGTYTLIDVANVVISTVNHRLSVFVRDALMTNTTATTITVATGSNTSGAVHCFAISGMSRTGASAVRSKGLQNNQAASTAAPTLNQTALGTNLCIVALGSADTTTTAPGLFSERHDTNFATPTIALATATRDGGFSGTTITFGAATSTTFCSHAMELDTTVAASEISGTAALALGAGSSTLTGAGALAGAGALVLDGTATGSATNQIAGTATLTLSATGLFFHRITQFHPFGYTQQRYGSFYRPPGRVFGRADLVFGGSAQPNVTEFIAGTAALTFSGRGLVPQFLTQLMPTMWVGRRYGDFFRPAESFIAGTAALTIGGTALLTGEAPILGASDVMFAGTATLTATGVLAGSAAITFDASGLLDLPSGQMVGTANLTFGHAATLTGVGALASSTPLVIGGAGSATAIGALSGTAALVITGTGLLNLPSGQIIGTATLTFGATATLYPVELLNELGAYYRLDGDLLDYSGNDQHLTGTVTYAAGKLNDGLASGTGATNTWSQFTGRPLSISCWIKPENSGGAEIHWNVIANERFGLILATDGKIYLRQGLGLAELASLAIGTFQHVVMTVDAAGVLNLYVNTALVHTGTGTPPTPFSALHVTATVPTVLDEVGLWGRVLNEAEIETLFNEGDGFDPTVSPVVIGGVFKRAFWSWPRQCLRALWSWTRVARWRTGVPVQLEPMQLVKTVSESRMFGFDYSDAPEVANGTSVVDPMASGIVSGGAGLTFGSVNVNGTAFDDIPASAGLQVRISGGVAGTTYTFAMIGTTTLAGSILTIPCEMVVVADA